jgi:hypothetical protein
MTQGRCLLERLRHARHVRTSLTIGVLVLSACHRHSDPGAPDWPGPDPSASLKGPNPAFVRHDLPGLSGPAAVTFETPPYIVGTANDGQGNLTVLTLSAIGLGSLYQAPRVAYDMVTADFDGDGIPDAMSSVYSATNVDSYAYLFQGSSGGVFSQNPTFGTQYTSPAGYAGYRGRTETVVVADFNNDGAVDMFLPTYTYLDSTYDLSDDPQFVTSGPPPNVYNAYQSFLLLNDGKGNFTDVAVTAGVSMHSTLSGITPASTDPNGNQPEGAQAVDFNMDGLIDLYVGGHLFINQGVDANGVPHFKDMAPAYGLTQAVLRGPPPWDPNDTLPDNYLLTDEGVKILDWNNDGHLDLLVFRFNWGPAHGPRLFEFDGSQFIERVYAASTRTATCQNPPQQPTAFFWSSKPLITDSVAAGINVYDIDNDGLEDVLVSGDGTGSVIFRNYGCGFVEVQAGALSGVPGGGGAMALADLDGDGRIDVIYPEVTTHEVYMNTTSSPVPSSFSVEVLGPNGEHNQYGRVIQVFPPGTQQIYTRVVDGGSGYLAQNQYPILVGTPFSGAHTVKVYYAPLTKCTYGGPPCKPAILQFSIRPGQYATAYAPSAANPSGTVVIGP